MDRAPLLILAILMGSALAITAPSASAVTGCGATITANTTLTANIGPCQSNGLTIGANGVVLNCDGHSISGVSGPEGTFYYGIYVDGFSKADIKDCSVDGFDIGYELLGSSNDTLTGSAADNASFSDFDVNTNSNGDTLTNNTAVGDAYGFTVEYSTQDTLSGNNATASLTGSQVGQGFELSYVTMSTVDGNTANDYHNWGFVIGADSQMAVSGNTADQDGGGFIVAFGSSDTALTENIANSDGEGVLLNDAPATVLTNNTAASNGISDFIVYASPGSTLTGNNASESSIGFWVSNSTDTVMSGNAADVIVAGPYPYYGSGFYVTNSSGSSFVDNTADDNAIDGFYLDSLTLGSTVAGNSADGNADYGYLDASAGGGTHGTANTYFSDQCSGDALGGSSPAGLCAEVAGEAAVTTLATLPGNCGGWPMTTDLGYVYFVNYCTDTIQRVATAGGSVENVTALPGFVQDTPEEVAAIAATGPWIYWGEVTDNSTTQHLNYETIYRVPLWGGAAQLMATSTSDGFAGIATSGSEVYFSDNNSITAMTSYGTGLHPVATDSAEGVWQMAVSQGSVYWYNALTGEVYSHPTVGPREASVQLSDVPGGYGAASEADQDIVVANGTVFWSDIRVATNGSISSSLYSVSVNGGPTKALIRGSELIEAVADAGKYVAFSAVGSGDASDWGIFLVPKTGGPVTSLVAGAIPADMVTSGGYLYFSDLNGSAISIDSVQLPS